jgi:hypothetical protein
MPGDLFNLLLIGGGGGGACIGACVCDALEFVGVDCEVSIYYYRLTNITLNRFINLCYIVIKYGL